MWLCAILYPRLCVFFFLFFFFLFFFFFFRPVIVCHPSIIINPRHLFQFQLTKEKHWKCHDSSRHRSNIWSPLKSPAPIVFCVVAIWCRANWITLEFECYHRHRRHYHHHHHHHHHFGLANDETKKNGTNTRNEAAMKRLAFFTLSLNACARDRLSCKYNQVILAQSSLFIFKRVNNRWMWSKPAILSIHFSGNVFSTNQPLYCNCFRNCVMAFSSPYGATLI